MTAGFRPAHNVQFATDVETCVIVGVDVTNSGSDKAQLEPMVDDIQRNYGSLPGQVLADNGFVKLDVIEKLEAQDIEVIAPVQRPRDPSRNPFRPLDGDGPGVAAWRTRMGTERVPIQELGFRGSVGAARIRLDGERGPCALPGAARGRTGDVFGGLPAGGEC